MIANLDQMNSAIREAEGVLRDADEVALKLALLLRGRLRKVGSGYLLGQLKRELRDFNIRTGKWKDNK